MPGPIPTNTVELVRDFLLYLTSASFPKRKKTTPQRSKDSEITTAFLGPAATLLTLFTWLAEARTISCQPWRALSFSLLRWLGEKNKNRTIISKQGCTAKATKSSLCKGKAQEPADRDCRGGQSQSIWEPRSVKSWSFRPAFRNELATSLWILRRASSLIWVASVLTLWKCKQTGVLHSKTWHGGFVPTCVPCPFGGRIPSLAAVPYKAMREGTFQRCFNTIHSHMFSTFESTADPQVLQLTAQTQLIQLHRDFPAPAEKEISKDEVSTTCSQGHISKPGLTCESQIHSINCHADDFWEHGTSCMKCKSVTKLVQRAKE